LRVNHPRRPRRLHHSSGLREVRAASAAEVVVAAGKAAEVAGAVVRAVMIAETTRVSNLPSSASIVAQRW